MYFIRNSEFTLHNVGDTYLLTSIDNNQKVIFLNETSAFFWNNMSSKITKSNLVDLVLKEYKVTREIAQRDVDKFLEFMIDNDCIFLQTEI